VGNPGYAKMAFLANNWFNIRIYPSKADCKTARLIFLLVYIVMYELFAVLRFSLWKQEDESLKRVGCQFRRLVHEMDKDQLISMIHFLEKRDEEQKQENLELKELIKELQETHHQKMKSQADLLDSIDRLTKQLADLTEDKKKLQQTIDELLKKNKAKL
jgi:septal ring factor EnvC (AmiA/AmiB activator)